MEVSAPVGSIRNTTPGPFEDALSKFVYVDPTIAQHVICATLTQSDGSSCTECVDVDCCDCTEGLYFDLDASATAIDPGSIATVYLETGCPNFKWSVSGTGYTIGAGAQSTQAVIASASGT